jgi:ankyrin repeat protein
MLSFLKENGLLEAANNERMTPLMCAAYRDNLECVKELVELGVDVNKQRDRPLLCRRGSQSGQTALLYAVAEDYADVTLFLLDHGALQTATSDGRTPLHEAWSPEMAKLLIERGGDIHAITNEEETPLHIASHYGLLDYVKFLISAGLDKNASSEYGTPLQMALVRGHLDVVDYLLQIGATFEFSVDDDIMLIWLKENIVTADMTKQSGLHLKEEGLYERVQYYLVSIPILINDAKSGNVQLFIEKLRQGNYFYAMQVIPNMPQEAVLEMTKWCAAMQADMHQLFILFHSNHSAAHLTYPSPIAETLKQMILLPQATRPLLSYFHV